MGSASPPGPRARGPLGLALLLAALAAVLAATGATWRVDRVVYDVGLSAWPRPVPDDIVLVAIDDASLAAVGRWPWPRAVHATLLARLAEARPRAIGLDVFFSEPDADPRQDALLAEHLARAAQVAPVVLSAAWQAGSTGGARQLLAPVFTLPPGVQLGSTEATVDADGVMRRAYLQAGWAGEPMPHLALALLLAAGGPLPPGLPLAAPHRPGAAPGPVPDRPGAAPGPAPDRPGAAPGPAPAPGGQPAAERGWARDGAVLVRFTGPPGHLRRVSAVDVLRGSVPAAQLAGRTVLVGMTATGLHDTVATPVNRLASAMPGVEVLGNLLYTLRSGDRLQAASPALTALLSALGVLGLMAGIQALGARRGLLLAVLTVPLVVLLSMAAIDVGWWITPVPWGVAALLAYPLWSWRQLQLAVDALDAEIGRWALEAPARSASAATAASGGARSARQLSGDPLLRRLHTLQAATQTVRSARRFLADALAGLPVALAVTDPAGRVLLANARAAALFELERAEQLQGLDLAGLLAEFMPSQPVDWAALLSGEGPGPSPGTAPGAAPGTAPGAASAVAAAVAAGGARGEPGRVVEARLARLGDYLLHFAPVRLADQPCQVVTWADISPIRQAQRRRDQALAFVSHDLRAPASTIIMLSTLHRDGRMQLPQDQLLDEVERLALRALQLADDFVRVAHVESQPLQLAAVPLDGLLAELVADWQPQALAAGIELAVGGAAPGEAWVLDRALVLRAVGNLLSNAIKHSPRPGRVHLDARIEARIDDPSDANLDTPLDTPARGATAQLVLGVSDAGAGLGAAQRARLQSGQEGLPAADRVGVGLGLRFVQQVAMRHRGRLRALPGPDGRGLRVELLLGALAADGSDAGGAAPAPPGPDATGPHQEAMP